MPEPENFQPNTIVKILMLPTWNAAYPNNKALADGQSAKFSIIPTEHQKCEISAKVQETHCSNLPIIYRLHSSNCCCILAALPLRSCESQSQFIVSLSPAFEFLTPTLPNLDALLLPTIMPKSPAQPKAGKPEAEASNSSSAAQDEGNPVIEGSDQNIELDMGMPFVELNRRAYKDRS